MKKLKYLFIFLIFICNKASADTDTLYVYYLENYPYSYTENNEVKGIEVEIINEYVSWVKSDGIHLTAVFKSFGEFDKLYDAVKKGRSNVIGLGSVTINAERLKDLLFSPPYIKNVSILISEGNVPIMKTKNELSKNYSNPCAVTIKNSVYEKYLISIKKQLLPSLKITYTDSEFSAIDSVADHKNVFAYCDILSYWTYIKTHKDKFLKIQKIFTMDNDNLGFIVPKGSKHTSGLSEFFESGFGFIASSRYQQILEKYLGYEIIESVKVN